MHVKRSHEMTGKNHLSIMTVSALCMAFSAWGQGAAEDQGKKMVDGLCNSCHPIGARTGSGYTADRKSVV